MRVSWVNPRWLQTHGDYRLAAGKRFIPAAPIPRRPLHRLPMCWAGLCGGRVESDASGLWFQCHTCDRVSGFVPRDELDRQIDSAIAEQHSKKEGTDA